MASIDLVYDERLLHCRVKSYIKWDMEKSPHMAVSGVTGTGKTYLVKTIMARIGKQIPDSQITICDFKGDTAFSSLLKVEGSRYYRFADCCKGFNEFYNSFIQRQHDNNPYQNLRVLLFDEWASYINYLDKKEGDEAKKKLASLLMLTRAFNYQIILSQQRLDAESFGKSRDNFGVVLTLGNISKEVRDMLYFDYKEDIKPDRTRGTGYLLMNGSNFKRIVSPQINNIDLVDSYIRQAVER